LSFRPFLISYSGCFASCSTTALFVATTIWTVGHSNSSLDAFVDLLVRHGIEGVVDVRSSPYSRYASQFNREVLRPALEHRAISYVFLGDLLGGRVDDDRYYDGQGHVLYGQLAESRDVLLGVGLTRKFRSSERSEYRHWLQVNNIHLKEDSVWVLG
jgi:hypothetical protein